MKNAYDFILDENCRHIDHKYVKMCQQMKKTGTAQKYIIGTWMISLPYFIKFVQ